MENLIKIVNMLDIDTQRHSVNVTKIAFYLAKQMNIENEQIKKLIIACILHDIGKVLIDENILFKNSKLTSEEYSSVKKHCEYGRNILIQNNCDSDIIEIVYHHHERLDGSGYPNNSDYRDINLLTQICSISDSLEAMISRKYTIPKALEDIETEFLRCSTYKRYLYSRGIVKVLLNNLSSNLENFGLEIVKGYLRFKESN